MESCRSRRSTPPG